MTNTNYEYEVFSNETTSYNTIITQDAVPIKLWTRGVKIEEGAIKQLIQMARLPFIFNHIAVMPDVHAGIGSVVGSVIATTGAIVPAFVGVDIGCGMAAIKTTFVREDIQDAHALFEILSRTTPNGRTDNGGIHDKGSWGDDLKIPDEVNVAWMGLLDRYKNICEVTPKVYHNRALLQLGTLGTGNHFLELSVDENENVWIVLHSGSRGPGAKIANTYIQLAKKDMERYYIKLCNSDLAYIPEGTNNYRKYIEAAMWAQEYAKVNRELMLELVCKALQKFIGNFEILEIINCHHNYVATEKHFKKDIFITRKGAINAFKGRLGIIPGSMGAKTYIVSGLGNKNSYCSASHGAGRVMSRTDAKKTFTLKDHRESTEGVECAKDSSVIDETPRSYKPIDDVMNAQKDLVETIHTLKQFICVKGTGE